MSKNQKTVAVPIKSISDFKTAKKAIRTSNSGINIVAVNGCCYGRDNNPDKGNYFKYCGQKFWEFISGNTDLYTEIIEPLGHKAKEKNEDFVKSYSQMINKFTLEFGKEFCDSNGVIDWEKLVKFNSSVKPPVKEKEKIIVGVILMNTISKHNKSLHLTAIPLRLIAAAELGRYAMKE